MSRQGYSSQLSPLRTLAKSPSPSQMDSPRYSPDYASRGPRTLDPIEPSNHRVPIPKAALDEISRFSGKNSHFSRTDMQIGKKLRSHTQTDALSRSVQAGGHLQASVDGIGLTDIISSLNK